MLHSLVDEVLELVSAVSSPLPPLLLLPPGSSPAEQAVASERARALEQERTQAGALLGAVVVQLGALERSLRQQRVRVRAAFKRKQRLLLPLPYMPIFVGSRKEEDVEAGEVQGGVEGAGTAQGGEGAGDGGKVSVPGPGFAVPSGELAGGVEDAGTPLHLRLSAANVRLLRCLVERLLSVVGGMSSEELEAELEAYLGVGGGAVEASVASGYVPRDVAVAMGEVQRELAVAMGRFTLGHHLYMAEQASEASKAM